MTAAIRRLLARLTVPMSGIDLIAEERTRQLSAEGFTEAHDDVFQSGELAMAAACYAAPAWIFIAGEHERFHDAWPSRLGERRDRRLTARNLAATPRTRLGLKLRINELSKGGALIAAEIDRLERAAASLP